MRKSALLPCLFGAMLLSTPATAGSIKLAATGNCDDQTRSVCHGDLLAGHQSNVLSGNENRIVFGTVHADLEIDWLSELSELYDPHQKGLAHSGDYSDFDGSRLVIVKFNEISPARRAEEQIMETPEPGSLILLGSGLAGIFWKRRKQ